ncbi:unnamed protein product [Cochlearia groenlandica]
MPTDTKRKRAKVLEGFGTPAPPPIRPNSLASSSYHTPPGETGPRVVNRLVQRSQTPPQPQPQPQPQQPSPPTAPTNDGPKALPANAAAPQQYYWNPLIYGRVWFMWKNNTKLKEPDLVKKVKEGKKSKEEKCVRFRV